MNFDRTGTVAAGTGTTVLIARPTRLRQVVVTATGTGSSPVLLYDNASAGSGTVIGAVPGNATVGTVFAFQTPAALGIVAVGVASGPALTCSFDD